MQSGRDVRLIEENFGFAVFSGLRSPFKDFLEVRREFGFSESAFNDIGVRLYDFSPGGEVARLSAWEFRLRLLALVLYWLAVYRG